MKTVLLPTAYLPDIIWCARFWQADVVIIEACEHYQKGGWRNRTRLAGPNGVQTLSIPLAKGKHQQTPIRNVQISKDISWQRQHWRSIRTAYGNAPFFEHYADIMLPFYTGQFEWLFDYNLALIEMILIKKLGWKGEIRFSETFLNQSVFESDEPTPYYPQVFEGKNGFIPNLSVLDLLLCCGKESISTLEKLQTHI